MREEDWLNDYVFTVSDFFTNDECEHYIQLSEEIGYEEALVNTESGHVRVSNYRDNDRILYKNEELARELWNRAEDFIPNQWNERNAIGVNELFRFYRYSPGQQFDWHQDYPYERDNGESSQLTMLIYLNADFQGGETLFEDSYSEECFDELSVSPKTGMALFFDHPVNHKGERVESGMKYVLRTDVMYSSED